MKKLHWQLKDNRKHRIDYTSFCLCIVWYHCSKILTNNYPKSEKQLTLAIECGEHTNFGSGEIT